MQLGVLVRTSVEPITPELSQRGRLLGAVAQWQLRLCLGHERSEIAHMVTFFFFADFVTCANFSNLCSKFLKTHNRYGHHVSTENCASSWATISSKKNFEKYSASWFFLKRSFEKTLFLTIFMFEPLFLRTRIKYRVHGFV